MGTMIGFIGLVGSGKDSCADFSGYPVDRFAAPLKQVAAFVFGPDFDKREVKDVEVDVTRDMFERIQFANQAIAESLGFSEIETAKLHDLARQQFLHIYTISPRIYQQLLGTECVRAVRESAFADRLLNVEGDLAIPDVRFENELLVADYNVLVVRPGVEWNREHESEQMAGEMTEFYFNTDPGTIPEGVDAVIVNDGSLDELGSKVRGVLPVLLLNID